MVEPKKIICTSCPMGCMLIVTCERENIQSVEGNQCKRGEEYAKAEIINPKRVVTTTVKVRGGIHPRLPVHTSAPIPKSRIFDLLYELSKIELNAPVTMEQVILTNVFNTGVDIHASRDLPEKPIKPAHSKT